MYACFVSHLQNHQLKKQMLAAAVAAGVTATFGAPIGGLLFSIEVTSTYYMVSNLWRTFFCSCFAVITFKLFSSIESVELFDPIVLMETIEIDYQYFLYIILGLICGLIGSLYIVVLSKMIYLRAKLKLPFISNRWKLCITVAFITAVCLSLIHI